MNYYAFLDGFRAIGITGVFIAHVSASFGTKGLIGPIYKVISFLGPFGHLGVDIFFVISGFLITGVLIKNYEQDVNVLRFYIRRFFKIVPQYVVVVLLVYFLSGFLNEPRNISSYFPYFIYVQNYTHGPNSLAHMWSLAIEEHYYFFYPLIIWVVFSKTRDTGQRRWYLFLIVLILIIFTIINRHNKHHEDILALIFHSDPALSTLCRIDGLLMGCLLKILEPYYSNIKPFRSLSLFSFIAGIGILSYLTTTLNKYSYISCWDQYVLINIATVFLFLSAYLKFKPFNFILENPLSRWIGKISYALYLWHYPFIYIILKVHPFTDQTLNIITYLAVTIFAGAVSTYTIERFFLNLRQKVCP